MGALPKRRRASSHRGARWAHLSLSLPSLSACPQCHNLKPTHVVCPTCGSYAGKEVLEIKSSKRTV
ncbi:MAG: 50S ribosomal protein L32 [Chloroflexi bacterium]|jgi:large subunit ribosomal protein L32|nr:50S ribosomal protein L32 [Chloroflexota bacterium]MBT7081352.1 50S ribosomal protein L32 [Chloroflexota bacterium]MBT7290660.1 50S ribosomal protein L32 [Chloroflexota bacterium]